MTAQSPLPEGGSGPGGIAPEPEERLRISHQQRERSNVSRGTADSQQVLAMARLLVDQLQAFEYGLQESLQAADPLSGPNAWQRPHTTPGLPPERNAALERLRTLEEQMHAMLDGLPALVEQAVQRLQAKNESLLEQMWSHWLQEREQRLSETEEHVYSERNVPQAGELGSPSALFQSPSREEITKLIGLLESQRTGQQEARFVKSLLWVTISAFALASAFVAYAVLPRL